MRDHDKRLTSKTIINVVVFFFFLLLFLTVKSFSSVFRFQRQSLGHRAEIRQHTDGHIERDRDDSGPPVPGGHQLNHKEQGIPSCRSYRVCS